MRRHGVTPQHYQLMLALKGFPGREWATVRELADQLQLRHTGNGERLLGRRSALHRDELRRTDGGLTPPTWQDRASQDGV